MHDADRHKLLHGPYTAPALRRGDRATYLFRDGDVIITGWTDARIPWPRCQRPKAQGGSGLLVDEELARAVRCESSLAIQFWWGVNAVTVWRWRKALGVTQWGTAGSRLLHLANSRAGAEALRERGRSEDEIRRQVATRKQRGYRPPNRWAVAGWSDREKAFLGKLPDEEVAARIGRTKTAVRVMRTRLGIPSARDRRRRGNRA